MTLQSFLWSKRLKERGTEAEAAAVAARGEAAMTAEPAICVEDIFNFRQGAAHVELTHVSISTAIANHDPNNSTALAPDCEEAAAAPCSSLL